MIRLLESTLLVALLVLAAGQAHAATCTVNVLTDLGTGTGGVGGVGDLRYCITQANSTAGTDTIEVTTTGTVSLVSSLPTITESLTINGSSQSAFVIDGMDQIGIAPMRISGAGVVVSLNQLTITRGRPLNPSGGGITIQANASLNLSHVTVSNNTTQAENGGGIFSSSGNLNITDSQISGNYMSAPGSAGAGIGMFSGTLVLKNTWVTSNTLPNSADIGGAGIMLFQVSSARIENSTINNNINGNYGAGIQSNMSNLRMSNVTIANNSGGVQAGGLGNIGGTAFLRNCTLVGNSVTRWGGAIYNLGNGAVLRIANTLIADNSAGIDGQDVFNFATIERFGNNIVERPVVNSGSIIGGGTISNADPKALPLGLHGGSVPTIVLAADSIARNAGTNAEALDTQDQPLTFDARGNGFPRIVDGIVDLGAFESPDFNSTFGIAGRISGGYAAMPSHSVVILTDLNTGGQRFAVTNAFGNFRFLGLPAFTNVKVEGFTKNATFAPQFLTMVNDYAGITFAPSP